MGAHAGYFSVIQHNNLIRMEYSADALSHNDHRGVPGLFCQSPPQFHVGLVVKCGEAVVKQIYFRRFGDGPGNGKPLLLSSGHIGAALRYFTPVLIRPALYKFHSLGNLCRLLHLPVANVRSVFSTYAAKLQVRGDVSGKEHCFLGYIAQKAP